MKSFLRWAGSKTQLLPTITAFWQSDFTRYVEPFCGSCAVFFSIDPPTSLLADLNSELICTLAQVQISPDLVSEALGRWKTDEESYYSIRALCPDELSPNERAARFIYLNNLCFNGLYRTNKQGRFNVPYGKKFNKSKIDYAILKAASNRLQNSLLEVSDFETIVDQTMKGDFLYVDPPYVTSSQKIFIEYGSRVFSEKDLERLFLSLDRADGRGVKFVLSYTLAPEIESFQNKYRSFIVEARRNMAGFTGARRTVKELIITNSEYANG